MARYYDLDKLSEMIEARADMVIEGKESFLYISKWLNLLPTADVAPKSEVAREIFEEIEKCMVVFGDTNLSTYFRGIGWKVFAELKKKYTEGDKEHGT